MGTKHQSSDQISDSKKRRRVGFSKIDAGIEADQCIKIYLISSKEELDYPNSYLIEPVDLNRFFEEGGKIYGYQGLKITIWVSSITLHAYADVTFESTSDGGKGITDLKSALQNIFAENLVERKEDFLQTFLTDCHYFKSVASNSKLLLKKASSCDSNCHPKAAASDVEVCQVVGTPVGHLYSRLVPLVLLLVDGSNPIDVTDPSWKIYLLVQRKNGESEESQVILLGFAAVYHFFRYPNSMRLRLGQILVLPPYQRNGYGHCLLEVLYNVALSENVYDLTIEEPVDSLQHVRTCIDVNRLLHFDHIQDALNAVVLRLKQENLSKKSYSCQFRPSLSVIEDVRKSLKINKRHFLQCWEVLIYLRLDPVDRCMENFKIIISECVKADVIGKDSKGAGKRLVDVPSDFDREVSFVMFKSQNGESDGIKLEEDQTNQEEQLRQLVDERLKEIKSIAGKVSGHRPVSWRGSVQ